MRVALLHNSSAGDGASSDDLVAAIEGAGHEVVLDIEELVAFELALKRSVDLVVVAGGDGTVRGAVHALHGKGVPLAILPLGTANNIAKSLGIGGTPAEVAKTWGRARRLPFDLGRARAPWGNNLVLEGLGTGLVPESISKAQSVGKQKLAESPEGALASARRVFRDTLEAMTPRQLSITADGEKLDGEYLLAEVLNILSVGPNLKFGTDGSPSDGSLDLVLAAEADRAELEAILADDAGKRRSTLPVRRVKNLEMSGWRTMHVDDKLRFGSFPGSVTIHVEPGAIEFLV